VAGTAGAVTKDISKEVNSASNDFAKAVANGAAVPASFISGAASQAYMNSFKEVPYVT
jgi:hypothetical protein